MKHTELRSGNNVNFKTNDGKIIIINVGDITHAGINVFAEATDSWDCELRVMYEFKDLSPIPLTPEILEKCKEFKTKITDKYIVKYQGLKYGVYIEDSRFYFYKFNGFGIDTLCQITYLHQLQNLFFSLVGEELKVNL